MKFYFKIIIYSILLFSIITCNKNKENRITSLSYNNNLYVIDIDNTTREDKIFLSEYFKSPKTIILENSEKALLGGIQGLQTTDEYLFILDNMYSKGLFIFNKNGKFIRRIGQIGHGPGEYSSISDFTLDTLKKEVYLMDRKNRTIHKYDYITGKFLSSIFLSDDLNISIYHIQFLNDKIYTDAIIHNKEFKNKYMLQSFDSNTGEPLRKWLNPEMYNNGWNVNMVKDESFFYSRYINNPKYFQIGMDTVLMLKDDSIVPYLVVKDKEWLTEEKVEYLEKQSQEQYNRSNPLLSINGENISYNISYYFEFDDIIYFKYKNGTENRYVIFDKKIGKTRYTNYIENNYIYTNRDVFNKIGCADQNGIYEIKERGSMLRFAEVSLKGFVNTNIDKYEELMNLDVNSNPVIFYYERK